MPVQEGRPFPLPPGCPLLGIGDSACERQEGHAQAVGRHYGRCGIQLGSWCLRGVCGLGVVWLLAGRPLFHASRLRNWLRHPHCMSPRGPPAPSLKERPWTHRHSPSR